MIKVELYYFDSFLIGLNNTFFSTGFINICSFVKPGMYS